MAINGKFVQMMVYFTIWAETGQWPLCVQGEIKKIKGIGERRKTIYYKLKIQTSEFKEIKNTFLKEHIAN